jgi:hypothetical protein
MPLRLTRGDSPLPGRVGKSQIFHQFQSPRSHPDREHRRPSLLTHSVLPAPTHFRFRGVSECLEDLVAPHPAPLLNVRLGMWITFFHQPIFDTPQLAQFMRRTIKYKALNEARVFFSEDNVLVDFSPPTQTFDIIGYSC